MKLYLGLSQTALNLAAKNPANHPELREMRKRTVWLREKEIASHKDRLAVIDGLIERLGIALGEVDA